MSWIRALLPGVFAEAYHWKDRALRAEAQIGKIVEQYGATIVHEREQHSAERRELLSMLAGTTSQKPPQSAEMNDGGGFVPAPSFIHPINRAIQEFKTHQAELIPDDIVELATEEYLRQQAIQ